MLLAMLSRPRAPAAYPFIAWTTRSDIRQGSMQHRKERDSERVERAKGWMRGSYGKRKFSVKFVFLLLARESTEEKGGHT